MSELKCPNCGSSDTCYNIPDWENGKLVDPGSFECFNCFFHTGDKKTEAEIMQAIQLSTRYDKLREVAEALIKTAIGSHNPKRVSVTKHKFEALKAALHDEPKEDR